MCLTVLHKADEVFEEKRSYRQTVNISVFLTKENIRVNQMNIIFVIKIIIGKY